MSQIKSKSIFHTTTDSFECQFRFIKYIHLLTIPSTFRPGNLKHLQYLTKVLDENDINLTKISKASSFLKRFNKIIRKGILDLHGWTSLKLCSTFPHLLERRIIYNGPSSWNPIKRLQKLEKLSLDLWKSNEGLNSRIISRMKYLRIMEIESADGVLLCKVFKELNSLKCYSKNFLGFMLNFTNRNRMEQSLEDLSLEKVKVIKIGSLKDEHFNKSLLENNTGYTSIEHMELKMNFSANDVTFIKNLEKFTNVKYLDLFSIPWRASTKSYFQSFAIPPNVETLDLRFAVRFWDEILDPIHQGSLTQQYLEAWKNKPKLKNLSIYYLETDTIFLNNLVPEIIKHIPNLQDLSVISSKCPVDLGLILNNLAESKTNMEGLMCYSPKIFLNILLPENTKKLSFDTIIISGEVEPLQSTKCLYKMLKKDGKMILKNLKVIGKDQYKVCRDLIEYVRDFNIKAIFTCEELVREEFLEFIWNLLKEMECKNSLSLRFETGFSFQRWQLNPIGKLLSQRATVSEIEIIGNNMEFSYNRQHVLYLINDLV